MRSLAFEEIKGATLGAVRFEERDGYLSFHRFTEDEYARYTPHNPESLALKMPATSGIRIVFSTDSDRLFLKLRFRRACGRHFGDAVDILVNGELYRSVGNRGLEESEVEETVFLPFGENKITLVLPGLYAASLGALAIADDAIFISHWGKRKMLIYGDSITQGYDAVCPSSSYANQLALALDADAVCKAIGGEVFYPPLAEMDSGVPSPDVITVAYGVNDWHFGISSREEFLNNARGFFENLLKKYPKAKLYAISPIWTADFEKGTPFPYRDIPHLLAEAAGESVTVIDGFSFVPHELSLYTDGLHPNDEGYGHYAAALLDKLGG